MDDYVIGQDQAKKVLSVAVYNHYKLSLIHICEGKISTNDTSANGTSHTAVSAGVDWTGYDELVDSIRTEADLRCV